MVDDDEGAAIRRLKLNDIRDVIKSRIVANNRASNKDWPTPKPIPNDLPPVDSFALDFMPVRLAPWINDIATRLQCPPDYPAITVMTALGAVVGRKIGIKPQMKTDWLELPNVWGAFIGPLAC